MITSGLLPISEATNALGLFRDMEQLLLQEPRRLRMQCFITALPREVVRDEVLWELEWKNSLPKRNGPPCNTVGCFAGWLAILRGRLDVETTCSCDNYVLEELFGRYKWAEEEKRSDLEQSLYELFYRNYCPSEKYGTPEYAEHSLSLLRSFIEQWGPALESIALEPVDTSKNLTQQG